MNHVIRFDIDGEYFFFVKENLAQYVIKRGVNISSIKEVLLLS